MKGECNFAEANAVVLAFGAAAPNTCALPKHGWSYQGCRATTGRGLPCCGDAGNRYLCSRHTPSHPVVRPEANVETVYFLLARVNGWRLVKIGRTTPSRGDKRINEQLIANAAPTTLIRKVDGPEGTERALHRRFDEARDHGEWFRPTRELMRLIYCRSDEQIRKAASYAYGKPNVHPQYASAYTRERWLKEYAEVLLTGGAYDWSPRSAFITASHVANARKELLVAA